MGIWMDVLIATSKGGILDRYDKCYHPMKYQHPLIKTVEQFSFMHKVVRPEDNEFI